MGGLRRARVCLVNSSWRGVVPLWQRRVHSHRGVPGIVKWNAPFPPSSALAAQQSGWSRDRPSNRAMSMRNADTTSPSWKRRLRLRQTRVNRYRRRVGDGNPPVGKRSGGEGEGLVPFAIRWPPTTYDTLTRRSIIRRPRLSGVDRRRGLGVPGEKKHWFWRWQSGITISMGWKTSRRTSRKGRANRVPSPFTRCPNVPTVSYAKHVTEPERERAER